MPNKIYHIVGTIPKSIIRTNVETETKSLTHIYMTAHFTGLILTLQ
jgi:hypothetical protein